MKQVPPKQLTKAEREALAKVKTGYVSMRDDGELLIIDDTAFFEEQRREREEAERQERERWGLPPGPTENER